MVAFLASFLVAILCLAAVPLYGRRRPVGAPITWGEAIAAAVFAFFVMFWAYGVVPNQWLQWANNELQWTPTKILAHEGAITILGAPIPMFEINYEKLRDVIVVVIYGFFLTMHVLMWSVWNNRSKQAEKRAQRELAPSTYGRPLVKQA
jgi:hypothetical protein